jgi:hypothetical protein
MYYSKLALSFCFLSAYVYGTDWTAASNYNWSATGNWSAGVPTQTKDANFPNAADARYSLVWITNPSNEAKSLNVSNSNDLNLFLSFTTTCPTPT